MHHNHRYMIPKALRQVTLWVHPEGRVIGSLFLSFHTKNGPGLGRSYLHCYLVTMCCRKA